jgi:hypothetical protein
MHLRTFIASFGSVLVVLAVAAPIPVLAPPIPFEVAAVRGLSQCFSFAYQRELGPEWFPRHMRLATDSSRLRGAARWYRALSDSVHWDYRDAFWRPVAPDSMEIEWHHSPVIRLPMRGDTLIGSALPRGHWSLFEVALFVRPYAIRAVRTQCQRLLPAPRRCHRRYSS